MEKESDIEIDPEIWLHILLAVNADEKKRRDFYEQIASHSNLTLEKVELSMDALLKVLLKMTRSN